MGCDDGSLRIPDAVVERSIRGVRNIHHHTQTVHLLHHFPAEVTEPAPGLSFRGAVRNGVISIVSKGKIPYAKAVEESQERKRFLDGRTVLHSQENGEYTFILISGRLRGRNRNKGISVLFYGILHRGNHFHSMDCCSVRSGLCGCIKGKKGAVDSPAP